MRTYRYRVEGLDCAEEIEALQKTVGNLPGVKELNCDVLHARMTIHLDERLVQEKDILNAVQQAGMRAVRWEDSSTHDKASKHRQQAMLCITAGIFLSAGFILHAWLYKDFIAALIADKGSDELPPYPLITIIFYSLTIISAAWFIAPKAWRALRSRRADMNLLMSVAVIGAIIIGEWFEGATVAFLFALSLVLENWSIGRARHAISDLLDIAPATARFIPPDNEETVVWEKGVEEVPVGATVLVRPGERIPLDGIITQGITSVNEAPVTGESIPVEKKDGDEVFAGTLNEEGAFRFQVTKSASDTMIAHIIHLVEEAQSRRAEAEQWVEKFAHYYTPAVMVLAFLLMIVPPLFVGNWSQWFYQALVMLVIACPCALVISTPVTIVAGLASAARQGVLIKGGVYLETPAMLRAAALDKTGTLTYGVPEVQTIYPFNGHTKDEVLMRAASLEAESGHPIARAIVRAANEQGLALAKPSGLRDIKGKGTEAIIDDKSYWIGSRRWMYEKGVDNVELHAAATGIEDAAQTVIVLGSNEHVCGLIAVTDTIRESAAESVLALKRVGLEHIVMLTGDNQATAQVVADHLGIDDFRAEMLPEEKVQVIEELSRDYKQVAMIGDGINDAPAMAASTLGIAMGAAGSDIAIETGDIALMSDELAKVAWLISHSRRCLRIIKQNVSFALGTKAVFMILALTGTATLWMAIAADMGASLLVIFNGLRMLRSAAPDK
ncbi:MAG: heavy metal translocating P-type ATPase [Lentisphaeria bacterium]